MLNTGYGILLYGIGLLLRIVGVYIMGGFSGHHTNFTEGFWVELIPIGCTPTAA